MRRSAPRPLAEALAALRGDAEPATLLARVQARWPEAVGEAIAAEAQPVAEHGGVLTVECESAVWAHELALLREDLLGRLNEALAGGGQSRLSGLRVRTARRRS